MMKCQILMIYDTPFIVIRKAIDSSVMGADQDEQLQALVLMMTQAIPSGVVRRFIEMVGGDYNKLFDRRQDGVQR